MKTNQLIKQGETMSLHKPKGPLAERCPIRDVIDRVSDRWTVLVLTELQSGTLRFGEIKGRIPDVSQRMLSQTLRHLEENGLVYREVFATIPPKVEYTLSDLGHSFMEPVTAMIEWATQNQHAVQAARKAYGGRPTAIAPK